MVQIDFNDSSAFQNYLLGKGVDPSAAKLSAILLMRALNDGASEVIATQHRKYVDLIFILAGRRQPVPAPPISVWPNVLEAFRALADAKLFQNGKAALLKVDFEQGGHGPTLRLQFIQSELD